MNTPRTFRFPDGAFRFFTALFGSAYGDASVVIRVREDREPAERAREKGLHGFDRVVPPPSTWRSRRGLTATPTGFAAAAGRVERPAAALPLGPRGPPSVATNNFARPAARYQDMRPFDLGGGESWLLRPS